MRTDSPTENVEVFFLTENVSRTVIVIQCVISGSEFSFLLHIFIVIPQSLNEGKGTKFILILHLKYSIETSIYNMIFACWW